MPTAPQYVARGIDADTLHRARAEADDGSCHGTYRMNSLGRPDQMSARLPKREKWMFSPSRRSALV
jgi:hypothetical protein